MKPEDADADGGDIGSLETSVDEDRKPPVAALPDDLPKTLEDRRAPVFTAETEVYDPWQGE